MFLKFMPFRIESTNQMNSFSSVKTLHLAAVSLVLLLQGASGALFINLVDYANGNALLDRTMGTRFQVGDQDLLVTDFGFLDLRFPARPGVIGGPPNALEDTDPPDGLLSSHQAGIWSQTGQILSQVTISSGTNSDVEQQWRFERLPETVLLQANKIYTVGVRVFNSGDLVMLNGGTPRSFEESPDFLFLRDVHIDGVFSFPNIETYDASFVAPINGMANFRYTAVPEPSTCMLFVLSMGSLLSRYRKR